MSIKYNINYFGCGIYSNRSYANYYPSVWEHESARGILELHKYK